MTIGEVARRTGTSVKALRFYDELGILAVDGRSEGNYRLFGDEVLRCIAHIRTFQEAGLTLRQVQRLVHALREGVDPRAALLHSYAEALERIEGAIADLAAKRGRLRQLLDEPHAADLTLQCGGGCKVELARAAEDTGRRRNGWPAMSRKRQSTISVRTWREAP